MLCESCGNKNISKEKFSTECGIIKNYPSFVFG